MLSHTDTDTVTMSSLFYSTQAQTHTRNAITCTYIYSRLNAWCAVQWEVISHKHYIYMHSTLATHMH